MDHKQHFISCSLGHSDLNSHFKSVHKAVTRKVSGSTAEITLSYKMYTSALQSATVLSRGKACFLGDMKA